MNLHNSFRFRETTYRFVLLHREQAYFWDGKNFSVEDPYQAKVIEATCEADAIRKEFGKFYDEIKGYEIGELESHGFPAPEGSK